MTQFGLKNWAEVTKHKLNALHKTYDAKISEITKKYRKIDPSAKDNT